MGNRAFIQIDSERFAMPIVLYGHWSGEDNLTAVKNVLDRTSRVGDPEYLAAQIFYEFAVTLGAYDGDLSFGISSGVIGSGSWQDVEPVYVNADTGEYRYCGVTYDEYARIGVS